MYQEKGKRGENWEEKKENWKRWKMKMEVGKVIKKSWGPFFFFFLPFTFENDGNLFWVYQNGNFLPGKSISRREKNQEKWLCPLRKICLLRPCLPWIIPVHAVSLHWLPAGAAWIVVLCKLKINAFLHSFDAYMSMLVQCDRCECATLTHYSRKCVQSSIDNLSLLGKS